MIKNKVSLDAGLRNPLIDLDFSYEEFGGEKSGVVEAQVNREMYLCRMSDGGLKLFKIEDMHDQEWTFREWVDEE